MRKDDVMVMQKIRFFPPSARQAVRRFPAFLGTTIFLFLPLTVLLTGCQRRLRIQLPANFHGHVSIACDEIVPDEKIELSLDATGKAVNAKCPSREMPVTVLYDGKVASETPHITWSTTGDGVVRAIDFDSP